MVDLDLRDPSVHAVLWVAPAHSITDVPSGEVALPDTVLFSPDIDRRSVLAGVET